MNKAYLISAIYVVFGSLWIYFTDELVFAVFRKHPELLRTAEHTKGLFFVLCSGLLIWVLNYLLNKRINQRNEELSLFMNSGDLGFLRFNAVGSVIEFNSYVEEITGYIKSELSDISYESLFVTETEHDFDALKQHNGVFNFNTKLKTAYDQEIQVRVKSVVKKDRFDNVEYLALIVEDITDELTSAVLLKDLNIRLKENAVKLKESNTLLELENIRANQSNQLKSNFMAKLSHELRTPLNGILGIAEIIKDQYKNIDEKELNEYMNIQRTSAYRLLDTLNSILEITEIEGNETPLKLEQVDLIPILDSLKSRFVELSTETKQIDIKHSTPTSAITDSRALEQILIKLIENAIHFTENGKIEVSISTSKNQVSINVSDTGKGIEEHRLGRIFEPFYQDDHLEANKYYGSGLGLSLVKKYTELIGGKIIVSSEFGKGSTFTLVLPAAEN